MYVWAKIPWLIARLIARIHQRLLAKAKVSVSPGIGFGEFGDEYAASR